MASSFFCGYLHVFCLGIVGREHFSVRGREILNHRPQKFLFFLWPMNWYRPNFSIRDYLDEFIISTLDRNWFVISHKFQFFCDRPNTIVSQKFSCQSRIMSFSSVLIGGLRVTHRPFFPTWWCHLCLVRDDGAAKTDPIRIKSLEPNREFTTMQLKLFWLVLKPPSNRRSCPRRLRFKSNLSLVEYLPKERFALICSHGTQEKSCHPLNTFEMTIWIVFSQISSEISVLVILFIGDFELKLFCG
jgi:hypothetical protein